MDILQQIGQLMLGSVPTIVLLLITLAGYVFLVHAPLKRIRATRRTRTLGAMEQARLGITTAEARTAEYEGRMRAARAAIVQARERRLAQWQTERERLIDAAQQAGQTKARLAKIEMDQETIEARKGIEASAEALSTMVLNAVLPEAARMSGATSGA